MKKILVIVFMMIAGVLLTTGTPVSAKEVSIPNYKTVDVTKKGCVYYETGIDSRIVSDITKVFKTMLYTKQARQSFKSEGWKLYIVNDVIKKKDSITTLGFTDKSNKTVVISIKGVNYIRVTEHEMIHYIEHIYKGNGVVLLDLAEEIERIYEENKENFKISSDYLNSYAVTDEEEFFAHVWEYRDQPFIQVNQKEALNYIRQMVVTVNDKTK